MRDDTDEDFDIDDDTGKHAGELIRKASRGDPIAIDGLLERHLPSLRAYLRLRMGKLVRAKESESDLVQSICREVLMSMDNFEYRGEAAFKGWLCTMALRKLVQRKRYYEAGKRCAAREVAPPDTGSGEDAAELLGHYRSICTPSRHAVAREELARIEDAFDTLPEHYREVITLARIVGLPHHEIAEQMGRSEIATQRLLARALVRLSEVLHDRSR